MEMNEYQRKSVPERSSFGQMLTGLVGSIGALSGGVSECIRRERGVLEENELLPEKGVSMEEWAAVEAGLRKDAGDVLWYLSGLCSMMGWDLEDIASGL